MKQVKEIGAAGVVFGILNPDCTIDFNRMKILVEAARPLQVVCHKAFDETPDGAKALETLIALNVDEVLTSGHSKKAVEGANNIGKHIKAGEGKIKIMAGGTVRAENVQPLILVSGVAQVHARALEIEVFKDLVTKLRSFTQRPELNFVPPVLKPVEEDVEMKIPTELGKRSQRSESQED